MTNLFKMMYYVGGIVSLVFAYMYFTTEKYIAFVAIAFVVCIAGRMLYYRTLAQQAEEQARQRRREERNKNKQ